MISIMPVQRLTLYSLLCLLAIIISFYWLDRPIAVWFAHAMPQPRHHWFNAKNAILLTEICYFSMFLVFAAYYWLRWHGFQHRLMRCVSLVSLSVVFAYFAKAHLQFLFGRYVPRYDGHNTLLFVRKPELYGFHWWQVGSFPSGHMAVFGAAMVAITLIYPRFRWVGISLLAILAFLLIADNYHFLSDVITGTYLGTLTAFGIFKLNQKLGRYHALSD